MTDPHRIATLVEKVLAGTASPADIAELDRLRARLAETYDTAGELARTRARLAKTDPRPTRTWRVPLAAAATFVIAALGLVVARDRLGRHPAAVRHYAAAPGERATIVLPDGSHVVLGAASTLAFVSADSGRDATLTGQAEFDVAHDVRHPFRVHTGTTIARDVGTIFVVRAYDVDRPSVAVASGLVAVSTDTLAAGDILITDADGHRRVERHANTAAFFGWQSGVLHYTDTPLADITADLNRQYDLAIAPPPATLARQRLDLTLEHEDVDQALHTIATLVHARYARHGRAVTFIAR